MSTRYLSPLVLAALAAVATPAFAHKIEAEAGSAEAAFDIVRTEIASEDGEVVFRMAVSGEAGAVQPAPTGELAGSDVFSYVWPTSLDSASVGFEAGQGILAFAVTAHPDFDDTPLYDNGDGDTENDGNLWHSHWVVLVEDEACGPGALKVRDIPEGAQPKLPETWPGLPILIDSPDYAPEIGGDTVEVRIPADDIGADLSGVKFDGVTAGLRVNASVHAPLLCVADVFDVASADLSLTGTVE